MELFDERHYVRCINPNDTKESFQYNPVRVFQQLRACGVLETIRISEAGFPTQRTYGNFVQRYHGLCKFRDIDKDDSKETCRRILRDFIKDEDKFKFGTTKVDAENKKLNALFLEKEKELEKLQETLKGI